MAATYTWIAVDARTGVVLGDIPDLDVSSVKVALCQYQSTTGTLPIVTAPDGWERATLPGAACAILLAQQLDADGGPTGDPMPIWGGLITQRTRTEGDEAALSLVTLEKYLDRRYVGDHTFTNVDQNVIIQTLITAHIVDGATRGIPVRVQITGIGATTTDEFADADDKTVYSVLTELAGRSGGSEWVMGWEHQANPERYTPVLYVSPRIGSPVTPGLAPAATFEIPGSISKFEFIENYGDGAGANDVMAVSTANGNVRPQSPHQNAADPDRPTYEYRYTPSTSITTIDTLTQAAQAALANLENGSTTVTLAASADEAPQLGVDWFIGDDVGFVIGGVDANGADTVPAFRGGLEGTGRAIGWELDLSETPLILPVVTGVQIGA